MNRKKIREQAFIVLFLLATWPPKTAVAQPQPEPGDIVVSPQHGSLEKLWKKGDVAVTFPTPMVELERVNRGGQTCPLVFDPPIDVLWVWVSQTEGRIMEPIDYTPREKWSPLVRRVMYRAKLRPGLRDLAGNSVDQKNWGVEFADDEFVLSGLEFLNVVRTPKDEAKEGEEEPASGEEKEAEKTGRAIEQRDPKEPLPARPRVRLEFSRNVALEDVAKSVHFQQTQTNERFPVEANIEGLQTAAPQGWIIVEPATPLPAGHSYLIMIDRLTEVSSNQTLPYQRVIPAGTTYPLEIKVVAGFNQPKKGASIRILTSKPVDPDPGNLKLISVEPPVAKLQFERTGRLLELRGGFDTGTVYTVRAKAGLQSLDQFALAKDSVWKARFKAKRPAIILPERYFFQRASAPLVRCPFVQVNTGPLDWKIATIPSAKLARIQARLREFGDFVVDENNKIVTDATKGEHLYQPTELLIPALGLAVVASGSLDASSNDVETTRDVEWKPNDSLPGLYLCEISGKDSAGRTVGNRAIISRSDWVITGVRTEEDFMVRLASMINGKPVADVQVQLIGDDGVSVAQADTDLNGEVRFAQSQIAAGAKSIFAILAGAPGRQCLQLPDMPDFPGGSVSAPDTEVKDRGVIVTDRNLYRPGETVKFKGLIRRDQGDRLSIPTGETVQWSITSGGGADVSQGQAVVSATGSWQGEWDVPRSMLGGFELRGGGGFTEFGVAEFSPLPFTVNVETSDAQGEMVEAEVTSAYFHGAPNAGAKVRWRAEWLIDDWEDDETITRYVRDLQVEIANEHSPDSPNGGISGDILSRMAKAGWDVTQGTRSVREVGVSEAVQGEATLGAEGRATLECKSPFQPGQHRRAKVNWTVDVIDAAAQTVRGGAITHVQFVPQIIGVGLSPFGTKQLRLTVHSIDAHNNLASGLSTKAELFYLSIKTVKERLGTNLNRYRNFPAFEKVWEGNITTPFTTTIPVERIGHYVVRVIALSQPNTPEVSTTAMVHGDEQAEIAVESETGLKIKPDRDRYRAGETATIAIEAPFTGVATVLVATDRILARQTVEIKGNAQRISVPMLPTFAPNAHVCVHLIKSAGIDGVPAERFGTCEINVERSDRELQVVTELKSENVEPGATVSGTVRVLADGQPVAGADVLLFAVDEAVLTLGGWEVPDLFAAFFPYRSLRITTRSALGKLWEPDEWGTLSHAQKGFILGSVRAKGEIPGFRTFFKALAFWRGDARSDANGDVPFEFKAPDNLTSYRVVAVAQHGVEQFGHGHALLRLSKKLQVEPALPDFVRVGDEVVLRAVVRQDYTDSDDIDVSLERVGNALQIIEPPSKRVAAKRRQPVVVAFHAKVLPGPSSARVVFAAVSGSNSEIRDAEDNTLPVRPATIEMRESFGGSLGGTKGLYLNATLPTRWREGTAGVCDVMLSGSPYLPKLAGLPSMLEAGGSLEKLSTRILAATLLAKILDYLPMSADAGKGLANGVEKGLRLFTGTKMENDMQPCWEGADKPNDFVTVETSWAILNAQKRNFTVNPELLSGAETVLTRMISGQEYFDQTPPAIRCFALMVLGSTRSEDHTGQFESEAQELFNKRNELNDEARAWLALGMYYLSILPDEQKELLQEIDRPPLESAFDPATFSSKTREAAICLFAQSEIASTNWSAAQRKKARDTFDQITKTSVDLSTQENLWLLLLCDSLAGGEIPPALAKRPFSPKPSALSKNNISVGWLGVPVQQISETFPKALQPGVKASYLLRVSYQLPEGERPPDSGLHLERTVRNLTDASRTGLAEAPFKLGDQVLITYELNADTAQSYVEVEDQLPACLETVNPKLPLIARYFRLPIEAGVNTLPLSHVELRAARTVLYFEKIAPGRNVYSVLAHVTTPGVFHWPETRVQPMYDARFSGVSSAMLIYASE